MIEKFYEIIQLLSNELLDLLGIEWMYLTLDKHVN